MTLQEGVMYLLLELDFGRQRDINLNLALFAGPKVKWWFVKRAFALV